MALLEYMERAREHEREADEVKQMLARGLGLVHPGHRSLAELAREVLDELEKRKS
jgi:hypothetical protein